jgi:peptidoglycan/LPS O-acetylase OafA/YrhL
LTGTTGVVLSGIVRRYLRLTIPIFFSCLLAYGCAIAQLFFNYETSLITHSPWLASFYRFTPDFTSMVRFALFDVYFNYDRNFSYNAPLWVMEFVLIGAVVIYAVQFFLRYIKKRYIVYLIALVLFHKTYYLAFILGMMLCDEAHMHHRYQTLSESKIVLCLFFVVGIYLGSYKLHDFWMYEFLNENFIARYYGGFKAIAYNIIGAVLITYAVLHSTTMKRIFSHYSMVFLGTISFSFYVLHFIVLCSLACFLFNGLYLLMVPKEVCVIATFVVTVFVTTVIAQLFYRSIENRTILFSRQLYAVFVSWCRTLMSR